MSVFFNPYEEDFEPCVASITLEGQSEDNPNETWDAYEEMYCDTSYTKEKVIEAFREQGLEFKNSEIVDVSFRVLDETDFINDDRI